MAETCVFVGDLGTTEYRSGETRAEALRRLGVDVVPFNTSTLGVGRSLWSRVNRRCSIGAEAHASNRELLALVREVRPDVVWCDKALWIYPMTLKAMRKVARVLVHYSTDDVMAFPVQNWLHRAVLGQYDVYFTTNRFNVTELRDRYGAHTVRAAQGFDPALHYPIERRLEPSERRDVVFIGHWEPATEAMITGLQSGGVDVSVWGPNWGRATNPRLRATGLLPQSEYLDVICNAAIGLCFLSKLNRNESTGRSFELPAVGQLLLTERTSEHQYFYEEGVEAAFFDSTEELVSTTRDLLSDARRRESIAAAGHARCLRLGLSLHDHMRREWKIVQRRLGDGDISLREEDDVPFWPGFRRGDPFRHGDGRPGGDLLTDAENA